MFSGRHNEPAVGRRFRQLVPMLACLAVYSLTPGLLTAQDEKALPADNPITRALKAFDRQMKGPQPQTGEEELPLYGKDLFDARTPQDPELSRRLGAAKLALGEQNWGDSVTLLQSLLEVEGDSLIQERDGTWQSLQETVENLLLNGPEELKRNYGNRFDQVAESMYSLALTNRDERLLRKVAGLYYLTPAGKMALLRLAKLWRDQGELISAAHGFERLARVDGIPSGNSYLNQAIDCYLLAGRRESADRLRKLAGLNTDTSPDPADLTGGGSSGVESDLQPSLNPQLPFWSTSVISQSRIRKQIEQVVSDLEDNDLAPVLLQKPLIVDDHLCVQTLHGLEVRDLKTGALQWSTRPANHPEAIFSPAASTHPFLPVEEIDVVIPYSADSDDTHQLPSLLYRDLVYNSLTTDGQRLFGIEQQRPVETTPYRYYWNSRFQRQENTEPVYNTLVAYDLVSGQIRWRVGGPQLEESFPRPLQGTYFFGAPTVLGDELFVIGEHSADLFLHCLSARTGEVLWSQMVASADRQAAEDSVRRWWWCSPVVSDDLVICPTTAGWVVAVDRHFQKLKWVYRYAPTGESTFRYRGGYTMHAPQTLNRRWPSTPPLLVDGRLIMCPAELPDEYQSYEPYLVCLDPSTGARNWYVPKGQIDAVYVAGPWKNSLLTIGARTARLLSLKSGGLEKTFQFPDSALPSGFGVFDGDTYLLPVTTGTLLRLDLKRGSVDVVKVSETVGMPGSLTRAGNALAMLSPFSLTVFPASFRSEELTADSTPEDRLRFAEVTALQGDLPAAADIAQRILDGSELPESLTARARELEWKWRTSLLQVNGASSLDLLHRLAILADSVEEQAFVRSRTADMLRDSNNLDAAITEYVSLLSEFPDASITEGTRTIRCGAWAAGRLLDLEPVLTQDQNAALNKLLQDSISEHLAEKPSSLDKYLISLTGTPWGHELFLRYAEQLLEGNDWARLSLMLNRADATAMPEWDEISARYRTAILTKFQELATPAERHENSLNSDQLELVSTNAGRYGGDMDVSISGKSLGSLLDFRFLYDLGSSRLRLESPLSGRILWTTPLQAHEELEHHGACSVHLEGAMAFVMHQGVLHAISQLTGDRLFIVHPASSPAGLRQLHAHSEPQAESFRTPPHFVAQKQILSRPSIHGALLDADSRALVISAGGLKVVDSLTGQELWRDAAVSDRAVARMTGDFILLVTPGNATELRRISDGRKLKELPATGELSRPVTIVGKTLISLGQSEKDQTSPTNRWVIRAHQIPDLNESWSFTLESGVVLAELNAREWATLAKEGSLSIVDLSSGNVREIGKVPLIPERLPNRTYLLSDRDQAYVVWESENVQRGHIGISWVPAHGSIAAFERAGKGFLWSADLTALVDKTSRTQPRGPGEGKSSQTPAPGVLTEQVPVSALLTDGFEYSPVVLIAGNLGLNRGDLNLQRTRFVCINKKSGKLVLDGVRTSSSGGFSELSYDSRKQELRIRTYDEVLAIRSRQPASKTSSPKDLKQ